MVEAAGVELITMLTSRKLLILGSATAAKKAPLPDSLYVYSTKIFSRFYSYVARREPSIPHFPLLGERIKLSF